MGTVTLPGWALQMRQIFRAETVSQFVLTGAINDLVPHREDDRLRFLPLKQYLVEVLFQPFEVVIVYDRGRGLNVAKGYDHFLQYLQVFDKFHGTRLAADGGVAGDPNRALESPGMLPRAPAQALELIDRFLNGVVALHRNQIKSGPRSVAVVLDYAHFLVPRGESLYMSGEIGANLIKIMNWAEDPAITAANIATVLLAENLFDLSALVADSPYSAKILIELPTREEIQDFVAQLVKDEPAFGRLCEVDEPTLSGKLVGLSRVNIKNLVLRALRNDEALTLKYLTRVKKEVIEKEAFGKLEFIESRRTLDDVAGHEAAKQWLREDAALLKKGVVNALPMGYLITGRIGTGKTYIVECFAGEVGIPFVQFKNFREKWVGATEGNLEKIFNILHALGQVVVFVDEADQATGRRGGGEGDSGLSGRIYGMLAKEMADTANRGKILWIFATSRPDLLEVDLKRQGRLDVHIPLFPPDDEAGKRELFLAMAAKLKVALKPEEVPAFDFPEPVSGNELEGLLVRAIRRFELQQSEPKLALPEILRMVAAEWRPSAHTAQLEMMALLAVKECTADRFLPPRFRDLPPREIDQRLEFLM